MSSDAEKVLIARYQKRLPDKLCELRERVNAQDMYNCQLQLHKLAGSAGMYGFESISSLAAQLEGVIVSGEALDSTMFQTLFEALCAKVNQSNKGV